MLSAVSECRRLQLIDQRHKYVSGQTLQTNILDMFCLIESSYSSNQKCRAVHHIAYSMHYMYVYTSKMKISLYSKATAF